jgi:putative transposase
MNDSTRITPEASVSLRGHNYCIKHILDLETVLAIDETTGEFKRLFIKDLTEINKREIGASEFQDIDIDAEISSVSSEDWEEANRRYEAIKPLLNSTRRTKKRLKTCRWRPEYIGRLFIAGWKLIYVPPRGAPPRKPPTR